MQDDTTNNIPEDENLEEDEHLTNQDDDQQVEEPEQQEDEQSESEEPAPEEPVVEEQPEQEERQPSRREQLRVQDLLRKYGNPSQQRQEQPQQRQPEQRTNWRELIDADEEVYERLEKQEQAAVDNGVKLGRDDAIAQVNTVRWESRLMAETPQVEAKYEFLNKNSDKFKPAAADAINSWYLNMVGYDPDTNTVANPNLRYSEFVEAFMELNDEVATEKIESTRRNVTQQARRTGLRPDGSAAKGMNLDKDPSEMSDEELNAVLSQTFRNI